jgi:hypothetical protein
MSEPTTGPRKRTVERPLTEGWLTGSVERGRGVAHFYRNGHSACHRWISTTLDGPSRPEDFTCEECRVAVSR